MRRGRKGGDVEIETGKYALHYAGGGINLEERERTRGGTKEVKGKKDLKHGNHCASFIPGNTNDLPTY